jgi:protein required for attachment to host cells
VDMKLYIAAPVGDEIVPPLEITADEPFPELSAQDERSSSHAWTVKIRNAHERCAEEIAERLWRSLPGGTWDRLVAKMVERHATLLRVKR